MRLEFQFAALFAGLGCLAIAAPAALAQATRSSLLEEVSITIDAGAEYSSASLILSSTTIVPNQALSSYSAFTAASTPTADRQGLPNPGQFVLGGWLNSDEYPESIDTPAEFNNRLGYSVGSFQVRQSIPPMINATDGSQILVNISSWNDDTDASVFFTLCKFPNIINSGYHFYTIPYRCGSDEKWSFRPRSYYIFRS